MKFNRLERTRISAFNETRTEVILDFEDDWHYALRLRPGMKKEEVASILAQAAQEIHAQATRNSNKLS